jgi:hypothetical protein
MSILTIEEFSERRQGDREPLLNFKWHCLTMPFDFDTDYVENANIPFPSLNVKEIMEAGKKTYYPGFLELSSFDLTLYEDVSARSRKYIQKWQERIRHPTEGYYYLPSNYKRDIEFELLNNQNQVVLTVRLLDCWPTQGNAWELVPNGGDRLTVQQNFATDGMEYF